jgi:hypothetical protein
MSTGLTIRDVVDLVRSELVVAGHSRQVKDIELIKSGRSIDAIQCRIDRVC